MALEQMHEQIKDLSDKTRDMHRALASLIEELEAVAWYSQRAEACTDNSLKKILEHNANEEKEHAAMLMEWVRRNDNEFSDQLKEYLFTEKEIKD